MGGRRVKLWPAKKQEPKNEPRSVAFTHRLMSMIGTDSFLDGYPFGFGSLFGGSLIGDKEQIGQEYLSYVQSAYKANPIIYALVKNRADVFAEARFQFRERVDGRPGRVFGTSALAPLEAPWFGGATKDLLAMAEVHNACAGNFFCARIGDQIRIMRPDWTWLVLGSPDTNATVGPLDLRAEVIGYLYFEGGRGQDPILLQPSEVAHYKPSPDPELPYRGLSWLTPCLNEILADKAMTRHRKLSMDGGGTPSYCIKLDVEEMQEFNEWVEAFKQEREDADLNANPYKTLFLSAVGTPMALGAKLGELDFVDIQAAGEARIASAAGVSPTVAGFWAGLQGSALNAGNFEAAFAQFINQTIRPLWTDAARAFSTIVDIPGFAPHDGAKTGTVELWLDDRDIAALAQDAKKASDITAQDASTIANLVMNGWDADAAVRFIQTRDPAELTGQHSGLPSVQLQVGANGNGNGNGNGARKALPAHT